MNSQQGFALIVVAVLLLVISVIGIIALKRSSTDLQVATAAQVSKLNFQANNIALAKIEQESRADASGNKAGRHDTLQGYLSRPGEQYINAEIVLCLRKDAEKLFNTLVITEKNALGYPLAARRDSGFCDTTNNNHYVSEGRIVTQLTLRKTKESNENQAFGGEAIATSSDDFVSTSSAVNTLCSYFDAHAVSLIPSYSNASRSSINECLKLPVEMTEKIDTSRYSETIGQCLSRLGVPHNIQVQTFRGQATDFKCIS